MRHCMRPSSRLRWRRSSCLRLRSPTGAAAFARQTREEGRLLDGCKRDDQPLAAIKFHIRIRGAPCVGFFSCHVVQSFSLGHALLGWELLFPLSPEVGLSSIVPSSAGRRNAVSGWFKPPLLVGSPGMANQIPDMEAVGVSVPGRSGWTENGPNPVEKIVVEWGARLPPSRIMRCHRTFRLGLS